MLASFINRLPVSWSLRQATLRLLARWRSITTLTVGVLLAAMTGASVSLYSEAISQVGLSQRLLQRPTDEVNIFSRVSVRAAPNASLDISLENVWSQLDEQANTLYRTDLSRTGDWLRDIILWAESVTLLVQRDGSDIEDVRTRLSYYADLELYAELVSGEWPTDIISNPAEIEVAIHERMASALNLIAGDFIVLDQRGRDSSSPFTVKISGIFRPLDTNSAYWMNPSPIRVLSNAQWRLETNVITSENAFLSTVKEHLPETGIQMGWRVLFNHQQLAFNDITVAENTLSALEDRLLSELEKTLGNSTRLVYQTELSDALSDYRDEITQFGAPFGLLLTQIGVLVLFFLVVMGTLVRRSERREIVMLKSRGAQNRQIIVLRAIEAAIICFGMTLIAPPLARELLSRLIPVITQVQYLPLTISPSTYVFAGIAGLVAFVTLISSLLPVLHLPLVLSSGATERNQGNAWWQRYNLDLILLVIGFGALLQIVNEETLFATSEELETDPLLILAPVLIVFAVGSIALRLFPGMMRFVAKQFENSHLLKPTLASWQVSREPLHYGRITFLLALAISMGWFAFAFLRTIQQSRIDLAAYVTGTDLRLLIDNSSLIPTQADLYSLEGVENASISLRITDEDITTRPGNFNLGDILLVDGQNFADVVHWRRDLGPIVIFDWGNNQIQRGRPLPAGINELSFWGFYYGIVPPREQILLNESLPLEALPLRLRDNISIQFRLRDASNRYHIISADSKTDEIATFLENTRMSSSDELERPALDAFPNKGWVRYTVDLSSLLDENTTQPLTLETIIVSTRDIGLFSGQGSDSKLYLRDLTVTDSQQEQQDLDWLSDASNWQRVNDVGIQINSITSPIKEDDILDTDLEARSLLLEWQQDENSARFGVLLDHQKVSGDPTNEGIPALISDTYAERENLNEGQLFNLVIDRTSMWLEVAEITRYYPTLYAEESDFIVVDLQSVLNQLSYRPGSFIQPNELWIDLNDDAEVENFLLQFENRFDQTRIIEVKTLEQTIRELETDLLSLGLLGLLFLSTLIGAILSIISLITYTGISVQDRRTEFTVLRAMGMSARDISIQLALEQVFVVTIALILGIGVGLLLAFQVLPVLAQNTGQSGLTLPYTIVIRPLELLLYVAVIIVLLVIQIGVNDFLIRRQTISQALRTTGE